ncbi:MAG: nicotinamide riboside transporter PnuC, partial [Chitinophagaceae bacterium]
IMVLSIAATVLLAQKKLDSWYYWIVTDVICVMLYFVKGVYFLSLEYLIFLMLASYGWYNWKRKVQHD